MKKTLSMIFIGILLFSTLTLAYVDETDESQEINCLYPEGSNHVTGCTDVVGPNYVPPEQSQMQLDVVFVIDSTGSMHDEIRTVKEELTNIIHKINSGYPRPDVRVGVVTYRDYKPNEHEYLTREKQLTRNTESIVKFIRDIEAHGGGDYEEAVEAGLDEAINHMNWRNSAHKIIILVGDAPAREYPEQNYYGNEPEQNYQKYNWRSAIDDADDKGIRIYTASGSGMNNEGINQWKKIAEKTGGSYIKLFYERRVIEEYYEERKIPKMFATEARASADYEPKTDSVVVNNLGIFAEKSLMNEAKAAGVDYSDSLDDITGDFVKEPQNNFQTFFKEIFSKLMFWK